MVMATTIAAIATGRGAAGVGIIRISGDEAKPIAQKVFMKKDKGLVEFKPRFMHYGYVYNDKGQIIDEALAVYMPAPHSFTGEDVCEIQCHGGEIVLREVLKQLFLAGAKEALPGEFTKRAFLSGRLDLSQAEAIADIIDAKSRVGLTLSEKQLQGTLKQEVEVLGDNLLDILAAIEVSVDYPEEEDYAFFQAGEYEKLKTICEKLENISKQYESTRIYREGLRIVIIGAANAGKSTLLNALMGKERAIVTDIEGTTRDTIEGNCAIEGVPVVFVDTAGIRESNDLIERMGIEKSKSEAISADLIILLIDGERYNEMEKDSEAMLDNILLEQGEEKSPVFVVVNKEDKIQNQDVLEKAENHFKAKADKILQISAAEKSGVENLKKEIAEIIREKGGDEQEINCLLNERQAAVLKIAIARINDALAGIERGEQLDIVSIDVEEARIALGEITGKTASDDIITRIFEKFCLGK